MAASGGERTPASITDVAALAKVSIATVSRVLSGKRSKDDDIARRVREAAEQLDYSVNRSASALRGSQTKTLGLIVPDAAYPFCGRLIDALEQEADDRDLQLFIGVGNTHALQNARFESLVDRNVDGIVMVPAPGTNVALMASHHPHRLPIVQIGGHRHASSISLVTIDTVLGMEELIAHLVAQGCQCVATLTDSHLSFDAAEQLTMLHTQLRSYGINAGSPWHRACEPTMQDAFLAVTKMVQDSRANRATAGAAQAASAGQDAAQGVSQATQESQRRPDAIICANDALAAGAITAMRAQGLRVPQDVHVAINGLHATPSITGLEAPFELIAKETLRILANGPDYSAHVSLPPQLVVHSSTQASATA
ncbi:LacI family DNA-binding transcriptional regulator [Bifidobacterium gallicum]|uniref:Putative maltose regulon regulatory protein MalI n=1 Tax=Bifidobacterium gallicum DSM 20093 = LMG 11596 TaxID=561180 RepID=D1NVV2_9BIFI|nr:LacI family DNA-binding transcriptional regulator [Bifidobacterium gallicum]EFA22238.1 transcriptional regulator, LacI family [Bifidobacterium gallicum DSM 20093 = LMG 11596]KFI57062.1 putative maltose regulon regulatory protein MalI [Bifidobacterium gallicum DSM 20093 = LMG 11596]